MACNRERFCALLCGKFNGTAKERNENSALACDQLCETLR